MSFIKKFQKQISIFAAFVVSTFPLIAGAQLIKSEIITGNAIIVLNRIVAIAVILAFLFFVWGIAQFIRGADEPEKRSAGRQQMIWGVVALAVLVSIWGIVFWLQSEFGIIGGGPSDDIGSIYQINP